MDMYPKYISPFGYQTNNGKIDSYGVDHSGFTTRDELEYQFARDKREQDLMKQYNAQGITSNYPQYGTNFWGNSANNYGFGSSNISANIENMQNTLNQEVQYAQPNMENNINQNPNYISDNVLYQRMWNNIKKYENVKYHPYLDSKHPATDTQKLMGYNKLKDLSNQKDIFGNYLNRNRTADSFLNDTNLQISEQDAYNMAQNHMKNDFAHVRKEFTDFDYFPNPLKEIL